MKIAVLDSDITEAKSICEFLTRESYQCHAFASSKEMVKQFLREPYAAIVLNLEHPEQNVDLVREVRKQISGAIPILCITGAYNEDRLMASLHAGANDYLVRPIRHRDLATRMSVLLRQAYPSQATGEQFKFGSYAFEPRRERLTLSGKPISITKKEFELALLLFRHLGRPLSRTTIVETVWSENPPELSRTIDTHIARIRNKLELVPERGYRLSPVYGFGYRLDELKTNDEGSQQTPA